MARATSIPASIPVVLPEGDGRQKQCIDCVRRRLEGRPGIRRVGVGSKAGQTTLELDYDPKLVTLAALEREVQNASGCLDPNNAHLILRVDGMHSVDAERAIERGLFGLAGVSAAASYSAGTLRLEFDRRQCPLPEIVRRLDRLGYTTARAGEPVSSTEPMRLARRTASVASRLATARHWALGHAELSLVILGGVLLLAGFLVGLRADPAGGLLDPWNLARIALLVLSAVCTSTETGPEAWGMLRRFKLDVDVLMFAAAIGAASLGHFEEGALLLFLFGLGSAGEHLALSRARSSIEALTRVAPETATLMLEGGVQRQVGVKEVAEGDRVLVGAFEKIPVDGEVIEGSSAVDQAPITGESVPVEKSAGSEVFAGSLNTGGRLIVRCTRPSSQSTLARIIQLVEEAQSTKSSTQLFTDKVERVYVPLVMVATVALIVLPPLFGLRGWGNSFYAAMAFLTAGSPCALAIGTPAAMLCAIARAARIGVLIKGGVHLETLGTVRAFALDKTGTLTTGKLSVTACEPEPGYTEGELLRLAAAVESAANHPLAASIVAHARARGVTLPEPLEPEQLAAIGVTASIDGKKVFAGKPSVIVRDAAAAGTDTTHFAATVGRMKRDGLAVVGVSIEGKPVGVIALADTPREGFGEALQALHRLGVKHVAMLTGDHHESAERVAELARPKGTGAPSFDAVHAELMPEDKLRLLGEMSTKFGPVAMVGDGVNDAPALAQASVGIAMGGAGSAVAMETADVVLLSSDIRRLPAALDLARRARRIIHQNLVIALGVIAVVAPLAALGMTRLSVAVFLHEGSTIVVVLNSLRLLRKTGGMGPAENAKT